MSQGQAAADRLWTPANIITMLRIGLVPVFVAILLSPWPEWLGFDGITHSTKSLIAALIFVLISCTDWIDGYLARSRNEVTDFGKFMDPLADKILVAAALLALVELDVLPSWPVLIILVREFIVSGVRMIAATKGEVIAASWYGKIKTVLQIVAIVLFLIKDSLHITSIGYALTSPLFVLSWVTMIAALAFTILSMCDYLSKARHLLGFAPRRDVAVQGHPEDEGALANEVLAEKVIEAASAAGATIATAESLTGGLISAALTSVPGSSAVVRGGIVSYVNEVKASELGVDAGMLATQGAVSSEVALSMAKNAREKLGVSVAVSVTGIAGPGGEEPGKPVGTVWMGVSSDKGTSTHVYHFEGSREEVREQTVHAALVALLEELA